jgi:hypothetical protein
METTRLVTAQKSNKYRLLKIFPSDKYPQECSFICGIYSTLVQQYGFSATGPESGPKFFDASNQPERRIKASSEVA